MATVAVVTAVVAVVSLPSPLLAGGGGGVVVGEGEDAAVGSMSLVMRVICSRASELQVSFFFSSEYLLWEMSRFLFSRSSSSPGTNVKEFIQLISVTF